MNRLTFLLLWIAIAATIFTFMVIAWRARKRRDAHLKPEAFAPSGEPIASFGHVGYVSTTPVGEPLVRVAVPGLSYKGWADVAVHSDGVAIAVTGEPRVGISASHVLGTNTASGRIGKVVERDGLALLQWETIDHTNLESSFRFSSPTEQLRFSAAIAEMTPHTPDTMTATTSPQEDA